MLILRLPWLLGLARNRFLACACYKNRENGFHSVCGSIHPFHFLFVAAAAASSASSAVVAVADADGSPRLPQNLECHTNRLVRRILDCCDMTACANFRGPGDDPISKCFANKTILERVCDDWSEWQSDDPHAFPILSYTWVLVSLLAQPICHCSGPCFCCPCVCCFCDLFSAP